MMISEMKVFAVDFFFSVNEMFFAVVLLFSLLYATSLDGGSPSDIASRFSYNPSQISKLQDSMDHIYYLFHYKSVHSVFHHG